MNLKRRPHPTLPIRDGHRLLAVYGIDNGAVLSSHRNAVLAGIYAEAALHHAYVALILNPASDPGSVDLLKPFDHNRPDGLIHLDDGELHVSSCAEVDTPKVVITDAPDRPGQTAVRVDYQGAAQEALGELRGHGHRRIGYIGPPIGGEIAGCRRSTIGAALDISPHYHAITDTSGAVSAVAAARQLLSSSDRPTAIVCFDDRLALGIYEVADELGLEIPRDLSVIAFDDDDISVASYLQPAMTTFKVPHAELGREAVRLISAAIKQSGSTGAGVQLSCSLERRESVGFKGSDSTPYQDGRHA